MTDAVTPPSLTILAVFAHPDDEIGAGSTLARCGDAGVRTVLACASRGEAATIFCEDCATRETLAEVRTRELECACQHLGVGELRWLDWPDGRIQDLPRDDAIGQIVGLIREIRPHIILTHPENGLYPHPDHLAVWEIVHDAFLAAADPEFYPGQGAPWEVARLFTRALPQSFFERAPGLAQFRVNLNGQQLPFFGTPDDQIDVVMHVEPWVARRMAAWDCHRSQHNPEGFSSTMPDGMRQEMAANEHYVLAAARIPLPEDINDDLLAGLADAQSTSLQAEGLRDFTQEQPSAQLIALLRSEAAIHQALAVLCQGYQSNQPVAKYAELLRKLVDGEQEILYHLSHALRQIGEPAGNIEPAPRVLAAGKQQTKIEDRLRFLRTASSGAASRLEANAPTLLIGGQSDLWRALAALMDAQQEALAHADL